MLKVSVFAAFVCATRMLFLRTFYSGSLLLLLFVKNMFLSDCQKNQNTDSDSLSLLAEYLSQFNFLPKILISHKYGAASAGVLTGLDPG